MTLAVRVIPCLDVDNGRVVKGVNFQNLRDAGDPVEMAKLYDAEGADELTFLDITASTGDRETTYDVVRRTAEQVFIPLTVGGGVRTADDVDKLLRAGRRQGRRQHRRHRPPRADPRDRRALRPPGPRALRRRPAHPRGHLRGRPRTAAAGAPASTPSSGRTGRPNSGAGEILLNSMDADGTKDGYDTEMIAAVRGARHRPGHRLGRRGPARGLPAGRRRGRRRGARRVASSTSATCGSPRSRAPCARPGTPFADPGQGDRRSRRPAISPMSARRARRQSGAVNNMTAPPRGALPKAPGRRGGRLPRCGSPQPRGSPLVQQHLPSGDISPRQHRMSKSRSRTVKFAVAAAAATAGLVTALMPGAQAADNPYERGPAPTNSQYRGEPRLVRDVPDHGLLAERQRLRRRHDLLPDRHLGRHVRRGRHLPRLHRLPVEHRLAGPAAGLAGLRRVHHRHQHHLGPARQPR